jgi:hypothetical protein
MLTMKHKRIFVSLLFIAVVMAMFFIAYVSVTEYLSIDICLDNGGKWDYSKKMCVQAIISAIYIWL